MTVPRGRDGQFDVVILGGGPSGASVGLTLLKRDGTSVAVVESSDYSSPRIGESLTPGTRPLLEYLDIWERFRGEQSLESFGSKAAWGTSDPQALDYMFTLHSTGWALDRVLFDRMLATTFSQRGGNLLAQTSFIKCERRSGGGWDVHVRGLGKTVRTIQCEYLIDATGRAGRLASQLEVPCAIHDRLVGVGSIGRLSDEAWLALESVILVEACEYGWRYSSPVPAQRNEGDQRAR